MKKYPRIYSLSTVGLIHHQEFDYQFHPFRTDFIGESGSGKSMIADLIQLVLVGSEAFESATDETRKPEKIVLQTEARSKGMGYAFLNIEVEPKQYLVVGCYIETGVRTTQAFIIQAGYDWQDIQYLSVPISFKQLLNEEEIQPIDMLPEWLDKQGLHGKVWQRYKEFHKILYRERIVPLDLASSERILNDYAGILQSFSRGKSLDTQKSESLKQFLFGNRDSKRIYDIYKGAEKELETNNSDYGNNLREIERVTQKQKALVHLKELKVSRDEYQYAWLHQRLLYYYQEATRLEKEISDYACNYLRAAQHRDILKELLSEEIKRLTDRLPGLEFELKAAEDTYNDIQPKHAQIVQVVNWLEVLDCTYEGLEDRYTNYKQDWSEKLVLISFLQALERKNVLAAFDAITDKQSFALLNEHITSTITELQQRTRQKSQLKKYANLDDPESLANWALQQNRAFSKEAESTILHFQDLPRKKPSNLADYLPDPSDLILSLIVVEKEEKGFWIQLNGIRKYIEYVSEQILDTTDESKIRTYFEQYSSTLEKDISQLEEQIKVYDEIKMAITETENIVQVLSAYQRKEELQRLQDIPSFNISEERFQELKQVYKDKEAIKEKFEQAKDGKEKFEEDRRLLKDDLREYQSIEDKLKENIHVQDEVQDIIDQYSNEHVTQTYLLEKGNISLSLQKAVKKTEFFKDEKELIQSNLNAIHQLTRLKAELDVATSELQKAKAEYTKWYHQLPDSLVSEVYIVEPKEYYQKYFEAETKYNTSYSNIIQQYIASESYRFGEIKDFVELAKNLLPEAFQHAIMERSDSDIIDTIARYLESINEKNKNLNNRKIQKIRNLLDEVDEIITKQENTARRIENFLQKGAQITGGYTARLRKVPAINYPKSWMSTFKEMIEDDRQPGNLQTKLGEKIDLAEMMKTAFHNCGGPLHINPTVQKLLDPSNYYELSFTMESESGRINKGSTGQIYAATALLCIARLSIMSVEEGKELEPAVRIMPIDEAEGLGSNYDMLHDIAEKYDYQLISLSINPVGKFRDGEQYLYMLHKNMEVEEPVNYTPIAILCDNDKMPTNE
ncbi:MAG: hypothetical protein JSR97_12220 [Verrucomicrobia bacterium]|nr:hypothetical protein [Verrucomicrobiota bacterium]